MKNGKGSLRRPTNESAYRQNHGNIFGQPPIEKRPFENEPIEHAEKKSNLDSEWSDALERAGLKVADMFND